MASPVNQLPAPPAAQREVRAMPERPVGSFPWPAYETVRDSDPQVKRIDLDHAEIASRPSATPKKMDEGMGLKHVGGKG